MHYIDLFSGIGGFALGAYWAGMRFDKHYFSEVESYAVELYKRRFPEAIPLGDITKVKWETLADTKGISTIVYEFEGRKHSKNAKERQRDIIGKDSQMSRDVPEYIITGGFPCQDISIAGKGAGIEGSRSGLWFEMLKSIRVLRPRFVIAENVGAITFRGLDTVLGTLAEIGYDAEWQDIRASDMGAPHRRERIWIISYPSDSKHRGGRGQDREENGIQKVSRSEVCAGMSCRADQVADANIKRCNNSSQRLDKVSEPTSRDEQTERSKAENWNIEPPVGRLAHGVSRRVDRLKGLGNSIVPQIADLLFRRIKELL